MVSALSHMGFSHRRSVLRPLFRTPHGLLGYQRSSACFDLSVCHLSVYHFSVDLIGLPTHPVFAKDRGVRGRHTRRRTVRMGRRRLEFSERASTHIGMPRK